MKRTPIHIKAGNANVCHTRDEQQGKTSYRILDRWAANFAFCIAKQNKPNLAHKPCSIFPTKMFPALDTKTLFATIRPAEIESAHGVSLLSSTLLI